MRLIAGVLTLISSFAISLTGSRADAYPEFIAYGYKTCLTCHYLGTGGGGLTDYGRAVFASEIAAKPFWNSGIENDRLAEYSNFLGKVEAPYWLKPGIKYRRLANRANPGAANSTTKYYAMQADLNLAGFTNEESTLGYAVTLSYVDEPRLAAPNRALGDSEMMTREYFIRWQQNENFFWYAGLFDKSFGIKHPDHTAVNRAAIAAGMNDQVHGVMMQWQKEKHDLFVHPYLGNINLPGDQQSKGVAGLYEYEIEEKKVVGASARFEKSELQTLKVVSAQARLGLPGNHALLNELGVKQRKFPTTDETFGMFNYFELQFNVVRGLYFQSILQLDRSDFKPEIPLTSSWGFGVLYFPLQRIEIRLNAIQQRVNSSQAASEDQWATQAQLHLSL